MNTQLALPAVALALVCALLPAPAFGAGPPTAPVCGGTFAFAPLRQGPPEVQRADSPAASEVPRVLLSGRVVDDQGRGLDGAVVLLQAGGGSPWRLDEAGAEAHAIEGIAPGIWSPFGFSTETDERGRYRFDVPQPTATRVALIARLDALHTQVHHVFSRTDSTALLGGPREVEDLVLHEAGALAGRVVDRAGLPLAGVRLGTGGDSVSTDVDGRFLVPHLGRGAWELAVHQEHRPFTDVVQHAVVPGEVTRCDDLVVELPERLALRVTDAEGRSLVGASVAVAGHGQLWRWIQPDAEGLLNLERAPWRDVEVLAVAPGYRPLDRTLEAGAKLGAELALALEPAEPTTFVAVNAADGTPVEAFGIRVGPKPLRLGGPPPGAREGLADPGTQPRPGGRVTLPSTPLRDELRVVADGYVPHTECVRWDPGVPGVQTLRLEPAGIARGRVGGAGPELAHARLVVEQGLPSDLLDSVPDPLLAGQPGSARFVPDNRFEPLPLELDRDGSFTARGLLPGHYRTGGEFGTGRFLERVEFEVLAGEFTEIGELGVQRAGRIGGTLRVRPGDDPTGIQVLASGPRRLRSAHVGPDGRFEFEAAEPGEWILSTPRVGDRYAKLEAHPVSVEPGAAVRVELDLAERAFVELSVRLSRAGRGLADRALGLISDEEAHAQLAFGQVWWESGTPKESLVTDADGWGRRLVVPGRAVHLWTTLGGRPTLLPGGRIELEHGEDVRLELDVRTGHVEVPLPQLDLEPGAQASHRVEFFDGPLATGRRLCETAGVNPDNLMPFQRRANVLLDDPLRLRFAGLPVGTLSYRLTSRALDGRGEPLAQVVGEVVVEE